MKISMATGNPEIKLEGALAKYAAPLAAAQDYQLRQLAEACHKNYAPGFSGLSSHDTRKLQLFCEQELARRSLKK